jgi:hypothetical protein
MIVESPPEKSGGLTVRGQSAADLSEVCHRSRNDESVTNGSSKRLMSRSRREAIEKSKTRELARADYNAWLTEIRQSENGVPEGVDAWLIIAEAIEYAAHSRSTPSPRQVADGFVAFSFLLRRPYLYGMTASTIAAQLGISEPNFLKRVHRLAELWCIPVPGGSSSRTRAAISNGMKKRGK